MNQNLFEGWLYAEDLEALFQKERYEEIPDLSFKSFLKIKEEFSKISQFTFFFESIEQFNDHGDQSADDLNKSFEEIKKEFLEKFTFSFFCSD